MVSICDIGRVDDDRDDKELIRFTGGRSLLRFVAPEEYIILCKWKTKKKESYLPLLSKTIRLIF